MESNNKIGSFVVLTRKNRTEVFLVLRSDFPVWEPQGGGIEKGETPKQCAIREAYEETGFKIKIDRKVAEYTNPKTKSIDSHVYEGKVVSGTYKREYPECEGRWFKVDKLPSNMTAIRRLMITDALIDKNILIRSTSLPLFSLQNVILFLLMPLASIRYLFKNTWRKMKL